MPASMPAPMPAPASAADSNGNAQLAERDLEAGRTRAVAEAFRSHAGLVERVLRRSGVAERDLGDARQEVFIVVHRRLAEFEGRASLSTWLYRIALHVASDYRRRAYQRHERLAGDARVASDGLERALEQASDPQAGLAERDPFARLEQRELLAHVLRALEGLDRDKREAFVLSELYELPMREVASRLGCPAKTAFSRTYAARRRILAELHKHGALPVLPLFVQPLQALRGLRLIDAGQQIAGAGQLAGTALAPVSALGPLGWFASAAAACVLALAVGSGVTGENAQRAPRDLAAAVKPARALPHAVARAAGRPVSSGSAVAASAPVRHSLPVTGRAARSPLPAKRVVRGVVRAPIQATALPPLASTPLATEPDGMQIVRAGELDLHPQLQNPLGAGLPLRSPPAAPARIRVRGPGDPADGVEDALGSSHLLADDVACPQL